MDLSLGYLGVSKMESDLNAIKLIRSMLLKSGEEKALESLDTYIKDQEKFISDYHEKEKTIDQEEFSYIMQKILSFDSSVRSGIGEMFFSISYPRQDLFVTNRIYDILVHRLMMCEADSGCSADTCKQAVKTEASGNGETYCRCAL